MKHSLVFIILFSSLTIYSSQRDMGSGVVRESPNRILSCLNAAYLLPTKCWAAPITENLEYHSSESLKSQEWAYKFSTVNMLAILGVKVVQTVYYGQLPTANLTSFLDMAMLPACAGCLWMLTASALGNSRRAQELALISLPSYGTSYGATQND
jgi:hypothetical protein